MSSGGFQLRLGPWIPLPLNSSKVFQLVPGPPTFEQNVRTEPVFVNLLRSPAWRAGTTTFLSYWPARLQRLAESILGSLNVYKYGFRTRIE
jgi:hypothetical protein